MVRLSKANTTKILSQCMGSKIDFQRIGKEIYPKIIIVHTDCLDAPQFKASESLSKLHEELGYGDYKTMVKDKDFQVVDKLILRGNRAFNFIKFCYDQGILKYTPLDGYDEYIELYQKSLEADTTDERRNIREECKRKLEEARQVDKKVEWNNDG